MITDVEVREAGGRGVGVFARRRVEEGEFVLRRRHVRVAAVADVSRLSAWERIHPCSCGAAPCTGTVAGSFFSMTAERQQLLLPHAPAFIRREAARRRRHVRSS